MVGGSNTVGADILPYIFLTPVFGYLLPVTSVCECHSACMIKVLCSTLSSRNVDFTEVQPISIVYSTSRGVMHLQGAVALAGREDS